MLTRRLNGEWQVKCGGEGCPDLSLSDEDGDIVPHKRRRVSDASGVILNPDYYAI